MHRNARFCRRSIFRDVSEECHTGHVYSIIDRITELYYVTDNNSSLGHVTKTAGILTQSVEGVGCYWLVQV